MSSAALPKLPLDPLRGPGLPLRLPVDEATRFLEGILPPFVPLVAACLLCCTPSI